MTGDNSDPRSLAKSREGDVVMIDSIEGSGVLKKRMLEMGFIPGSQLRVLKYAPLYDPMEVKVKHGYVSIRINEAESIYVKPVSDKKDNSVHSREGKP